MDPKKFVEAAVAAPAKYNQVKHAVSTTLGKLGSWFMRSLSAATPAVVIGIVRRGLYNTSAAVPASEAADRVKV
jgi:hypothetical protein